MKHFGSKEGLLEAIFDASREQLSRHYPAVESLRSPREKLFALLEVFVKAMDADAATKELMLLEGRRVRKEGNAVVLRRGYLQFIKTLDGILTELKRAGELDPTMEIEAIRSGAIGLFEGMLRDQVLARRMDYPAHFSSQQVRLIFVSCLKAVGPS